MLHVLEVIADIVAELDLLVWFLTTRGGRWTFAAIVVLAVALVTWTAYA